MDGHATRIRQLCCNPTSTAIHFFMLARPALDHAALHHLSCCLPPNMYCCTCGLDHLHALHVISSIFFLSSVSIYNLAWFVCHMSAAVLPTDQTPGKHACIIAVMTHHRSNDLPSVGLIALLVMKHECPGPEALEHEGLAPSSIIPAQDVPIHISARYCARMWPSPCCNAHKPCSSLSRGTLVKDLSKQRLHSQ